MIPLYYKRQTVDGVKKLKRISQSTLMVLEEAEKRGVSWEKIPRTGIFKLEYQQSVKYFHAQTPSETTEFAFYCCKNKQVAKDILSKAGLSVSRGFFVKQNDNEEYILKLYENLSKPLVVKQADGFQGNNVYLHIKSKSEFLDAIKKIRDFSGQLKVDVLAEQMFDGDEYRILASQQKVISVIKRIAANVVGDGRSTIMELIEIKNQDPKRLEIATYQQINANELVHAHLSKQGLALGDVLESGKRVFLLPKSSADISYGGDTIDVTDEIHPSVAKIVKRIMECIPGLSLTGIDYMTKNIHKQQNPEDYRIIEINASPSLDWNQYPLEGPRREVALEFLKIMFPNLK